MTGPEFVTVELFLASSDRSHHAVSWRIGLQPSAYLVATADARAVVHDTTALSGLAHGDETASAPTFVALLQIRELPNGPIPQTLDALAAQLDQWPWVDRERSTVVVGPELVVVPGEEPLLLAMAIRRRDEMSRPEFQRYWSTAHAELGRQVPGSQGYRQVHTDAALTEEARRVLRHEWTGLRRRGCGLLRRSSCLPRHHGERGGCATIAGGRAEVHRPQRSSHGCWLRRRQAGA